MRRVAVRRGQTFRFRPDGLRWRVDVVRDHSATLVGVDCVGERFMTLVDGCVFATDDWTLEREAEQ